MDTIITKTVHLDRTSETDQVPAAWAVAQIQRQLGTIPSIERDSAMLHGWRGAKLTHQHQRDPLEVERERVEILRRGLAAANRDGLTVDQVAALLRSAGL